MPTNLKSMWLKLRILICLNGTFVQAFSPTGNSWILYLVASLDEFSVSQDHRRDDLPRPHDNYITCAVYFAALGSDGKWAVKNRGHALLKGKR